jgi:hypothetical protein
VIPDPRGCAPSGPEQLEDYQANDTSSHDQNRLRDLESPEHAETDERHNGGRHVIDCAPGEQDDGPRDGARGR